MSFLVKKILSSLVILALMSSCAVKYKSADDGASGEPKVNLDAEEQKEIKEKQDKLGGSYAQLRKLYKARRYNELVQEAGKFLSKDEYDLRALTVLGLFHMDKKEYGAARIFFDKALEKHPNVAGLYNNIGVIQIREDRLEAAISSFRKAYQVERNNPIVQANLGSIYVKYMDYVEAEPLVEESYSRMSDNSIVANNYAIILRSQGQYEEAEKIYEKSLARDSRNISTNLNYAILLVEYMKKYDKARQLVNKIEFLNPRDKYVLAKIKELQLKVSAAK
jgi:Flp pilus assembly protein TadD